MCLVPLYAQPSALDLRRDSLTGRCWISAIQARFKESSRHFCRSVWIGVWPTSLRNPVAHDATLTRNPRASAGTKIQSHGDPQLCMEIVKLPAELRNVEQCG